MEFLNRIEIKGIIGNIRLTDVSDNKCARLSVVTNYCYNSIDGCAVIETTWHDCVAWGNQHPIVSNLSKGDAVHIIGRLKQVRYCGADGVEHTANQIIVGKLDKISE
jgi:single-stranded DNA-binding protein